jgi:hypothetical protein
MLGIPPAINTDGEDVVWALQTAEALWKRNERVDAIVWLRRAAQAAGETEDDDRAYELARGAAELTDWMARQAPPLSRSAPSDSEAHTAAEAIDDLLHEEPAEVDVDDLLVPESERAPPPQVSPVSAARPSPAPRASPVPLSMPGPTTPVRVRTAAEAHAGMLDPWSSDDSEFDREPPTEIPPVVIAAGAAFDLDEVVTSAPPVSRRGLAEPKPPAPSVAQAPAPAGAVDLSQVEALSDLPDDARIAFANAATVQVLRREDEVSGFALALVLEGSVDVAATIVDAAADRLEAGAVLRSRGTIASVAPVRIVGASEQSRVATWDQAAVTEAFRTCPWVEDELRVAGDRLQALVGITMGPLGERLDPAVRADVASRLRLHTLGQYEVLAVRGGPIPGFLVVGAGELELLGDDGAPNGSVVRPGEFLFPNESLRASPAPRTVRAAKGGALVLLAERGVAQELIVTCPPLLEIFAAM